MAPESPGPVDDDEVVARLLLTHQISPSTKLASPNALAGFEQAGLSVCRCSEPVTRPSEIARAAKQLVDKARAKNYPDAEWVGVVLASVQQIRRLPDSPPYREFCVYDTARPDFTCHAEVMQTRFGGQRTMQRRRDEVRTVFAHFVAARSFMGGSVWAEYVRLKST